MGGVHTIQTAVRNWLKLRTWPWFRLYGNVKPMLAVGKEQEEMEAVATKLTSFQEGVQKEKELRTKLEAESKRMAEEHEHMIQELEATKQHAEQIQQQISALASAKV